jgi:hypothetical protein
VIFWAFYCRNSNFAALDHHNVRLESGVALGPLRIPRRLLLLLLFPLFLARGLARGFLACLAVHLQPFRLRGAGLASSSCARSTPCMLAESLDGAFAAATATPFLPLLPFLRFVAGCVLDVDLRGLSA